LRRIGLDEAEELFLFASGVEYSISLLGGRHSWDEMNRTLYTSGNETVLSVRRFPVLMVNTMVAF
jgi:hypothetical protein